MANMNLRNRKISPPVIGNDKTDLENLSEILQDQEKILLQEPSCERLDSPVVHYKQYSFHCL